MKFMDCHCLPSLWVGGNPVLKQIFGKGFYMLAKKKWKMLAFASVAAVAVGAGFTSADTITVKSASVNALTGMFQYTITLDGTTNIEQGDGFVIYDFGGYVGGATTSLVALNGGGLTLSDFTVATTTDTGSNLNNPVTVNELATTDASSHSQLAAIYANPNSATNGLANPTFDDPNTPNLVFVYNSGTTFNTAGSSQIYTLTLFTSATNPNSQVSATEAVGEDNNPANDNSLSFSENLVDVPLGGNSTVQTSVSLPRSLFATLGLFGMVAVTKLRRHRRLLTA
jgi:hypothetical protein